MRAAAFNPEISISFSFEEPPFAILIADFFTPKVSDRNSTSSSFALPSTGGLVSFTLSAPPRRPAIFLFEERGSTLTLMRTPPAVFSNGISNFRPGLQPR